ncbi:unnamed protein product [Fusarium langsethiae]|nr:unnamed protein product [Fusarium langsethiae]
MIKNATSLVLVLPLAILIRGTNFRNLAEQTALALPALPPSISAKIENTGAVFEKFIRSFWVTLSSRDRSLIDAGLGSKDFAECFSESRLQHNITSVLNGFLPNVWNLLKDGRFTLRDLIRLPPVTADLPSGNYIYLRIYTRPKDQPAGTYRDNSQSAIDRFVGFYAGRSMYIWKRQLYHEAKIRGDTGKSPNHYPLAAKSAENHRYAIPLMRFDESTPYHIVQMSEQTVGQFLDQVADTVATATNWPKLEPRGCNAASPLFEGDDTKRVQIDCIPMVEANDSVRTFTTYRVWKTCDKSNAIKLWLFNENNTPHVVNFQCAKEIAKAPGLKPGDTGYLMFEVMDDHRPHDRAWLGTPSVGQFVNFDEASCFAVRFEWLDQAQQKWYSVPMFRQRLDLRNFNQVVEKADVEALLRKWRVAMDVLQALEGRIYTAPLNGFSRSQRCGFVPRPTKEVRAPALAIFEDNYRLMHRLFNTDVTYVATDAPHLRNSEVMNRAHGDAYSVEFRCDTCCHAGPSIACVRAEERTDVWVCRCCHLFHRPCTFTAVSEQRHLWGTEVTQTGKLEFTRYPTGPHRFLTFHFTMRPEQFLKISGVKKPFSEELLMRTELGLDLDQELKLEQDDESEGEGEDSE